MSSYFVLSLAYAYSSRYARALSGQNGRGFCAQRPKVANTRELYTLGGDFVLGGKGHKRANLIRVRTHTG
jgi:hypothetical protein